PRWVSPTARLSLRPTHLSRQYSFEPEQDALCSVSCP
ncbi:hypothetical protein D041_0506B, partial [Vibrio parahaemolyticus EKP-008]